MTPSTIRRRGRGAREGLFLSREGKVKGGGRMRSTPHEDKTECAYASFLCLQTDHGLARRAIFRSLPSSRQAVCDPARRAAMNAPFSWMSCFAVISCVFKLVNGW